MPKDDPSMYNHDARRNQEGEAFPCKQPVWVDMLAGNIGEPAKGSTGAAKEAHMGAGGAKHKSTGKKENHKGYPMA